MNRKKHYIIVLLILVCALPANAQSYLEALRYSTYAPGGTARGLGVAGAFGALGGDYTAVGINPAGLGMYRRSEVMVSLGIATNKSTVAFNGGAFDKNVVRPVLNNTSLVFTRLFEDRRGNRTHGKWTSVNFSFGYNRLADYNSERFFSDPKSYNSFLADSRDELNYAGLTDDNITLSNFSAQTVAGYNTYLLNPSANGITYTSVTDGKYVDQQILLDTKGGMSEVSFALGANYNDKVYFGALLAIPLINYTETLTVTETDADNSIPAFSNYTLEKELSTSGIGFTGKFGVIVRAHKYIRLGVSVQTPTVYNMDDTYGTTINSNIDSLGPIENLSTGEFNYKLRTPTKLTGSVAFLISKFGFISADYEFANMPGAQYTFQSQYSSTEALLDQDIKNNLQIVHTVRIGAEAAYKMLRVRGGYSYSTSPLKDASVVGNADYVSQTFSGGIGFRFKRFFLDATYYRTGQLTSSVVSSDITFQNQFRRNNIVIGGGFTF